MRAFVVVIGDGEPAGIPCPCQVVIIQGQIAQALCLEDTHESSPEQGDGQIRFHDVVEQAGALAEVDAPRWRRLFGSIDALTAFSLTTAWESGALDEEEQKNYFSRIGTPLETGWERRLISLNESFGKRAMAHVLDIYYGYSAAAP